MSNLPTGASRSAHTTPQMSPIQQYPAMQPPYRSPREGSSHALVSLPPLRLHSKTPPTPSDRRHGNPFGSILNPQAEIIEQQRDRRRSGSQMETPSPIETQHSNSLPSISRPNSVDSTRSTQDDQNHVRLFQHPARPTMRHASSPKIPKTRSINMLKPPTGTIDAQQSPFLTSNTRPSEIIATPSALPTPPAAGRNLYFPPSAPTPPPGMMHPEIRRPSVNFPQSGSASPIPQYSPYSQPASVASSQYDAQSTQGQYGQPGFAPSQGSRHGSISMDTDHGSMIPMTASGQGSVRLINYKGHKIAAETHSGSKDADEKRRRNAGASARFRARRKEKEREASMSISRLEQNVRNSLEDAEYYRSERDYWRSLAMQVHPDRHYARPPSPRLNRQSAAPSRAPSSTTGHGSEASYDDYEEESREEQRNVRRRTTSYHPAIGEAPTLGHDSHSYPVPPFPPVNHPSPQSTSQVHQYLQHQQENSSGRQPSPSERSNYRDTFVPDAGRYEHRNWTVDQSQNRKP